MTEERKIMFLIIFLILLPETYQFLYNFPDHHNAKFQDYNRISEISHAITPTSTRVTTRTSSISMKNGPTKPKGINIEGGIRKPFIKNTVSRPRGITIIHFIITIMIAAITITIDIN